MDGVSLINAISILAKLNPEQRTVVRSINGPYFVLSGPGSGKTKCLVSRTQYMLLYGIKPESVLLFTFTVKAANEIKERIAESIDQSVADKITIGTYHSVCFKILKKYYSYLNILKHDFTIYDQQDTESILKKICSESAIDFKTAANYISNQKDNIISPDEAIKNTINPLDIEKAKIYSEYQKILIRNNAIDFDDIIYYTVILLERFSNIRETLTEQYKYIISDESQDASVSNIRLLQLLSAKYNNLCMFLDDDQSIYKFRGADLNSILHIPEIMKDMKILHLNRNYRSTQNIVNGALSVIDNNYNRCNKDLFTENEIGEKIYYCEKYSPEQEGKNVVSIIKYLTTKQHLEYKDIAILYRNNSQSKPIEAAFIQNNIAYSIKNGIAFFERKEIKDIIAYVKFIINHYDDEAFKRVINIPQRGIGPSTIAKIEAYVNEHVGSDMLICLKHMCNEKLFSKKMNEKILEFVSFIEKMTQDIDSFTPAEFIRKIISDIGYAAVLQKDDPDSYADKFTNVLQLVSIAGAYIDIRDFINVTSLDIDTDDEKVNKVTLTTMHGCKGLEWPAVIMIGLNDHIIPGRSDTEEERRLFYVAMTRAKKYLFLSRPIFTSQCKEPSRRSRFIDEIDSKYLVNMSNKK